MLFGVFITKVTCGQAHTLALSDEGNLYSWGANRYFGHCTVNIKIIVSNVDYRIQFSLFYFLVTDN